MEALAIREKLDAMKQQQQDQPPAVPSRSPPSGSDSPAKPVVFVSEATPVPPPSSAAAAMPKTRFASKPSAGSKIGMKLSSRTYYRVLMMPFFFWQYRLGEPKREKVRADSEKETFLIRIEWFSLLFRFFSCTILTKQRETASANDSEQRRWRRRGVQRRCTEGMAG